jgi:LPS-assembly protein
LLRRFFVISLLSMSAALAQGTGGNGAANNWGACRVDAPPPIPAPDSDTPEDQLDIVSGKVEFKLEGDAKFSDEIILRRGNRILRADSAEYDAERGLFAVDGDVEFRDPETTIRATNAQLNRETEVAQFENAEFQLWATPARGSADFVRASGDGQLRLREASYTSCPIGKDDWMIRASRIDIDNNTGVGTARHARFRFKGVPVFYLPYVTYPVKNERKTGLLVPDVGNSDRRGVDISQPFYWNIAPQYDATITPRYMSKRGFQLQSNFRYLTEDTVGEATGEYLFDDKVTDEARWLYAWFNQTQLLQNWRGTVNVIDVSDTAYFEDLSSSLATTSQVNLRRHLDLEYFNDAWSVLLRFEDYENLDESVIPIDEPYKTLPRLAVRGFTPSGWLGMSYLLEGDVTNFERDVGVTGFRGRIAPKIGFPIHTGLFDLEPSIAIDHTRYSLSNTLAGENDTPARTAPIVSVNMQSVFERVTNKKKWLQTLEPRLLYTYIPFRDQDDLPVFDTITPDLNIVQLFRPNRFVGYDRLGDTNQLALGISTRLLEAADGDEFLRATVGAIRYFDERDVTLPGGTPTDSTSSDYLGELGMKFSKNWSTRLGLQWDSDASDFDWATGRLLYRTSDNRKIANVSYRFRRDSVDQAEVALAWPIGGRWSFVGRYNYSFQDDTTLEGLAGFEYGTCCWAIRANWRHYLATRDGEFDDSFSIKLILKGFGSTDSAADRLLDRGILGYD